MEVSKQQEKQSDETELRHQAITIAPVAPERQRRKKRRARRTKISQRVPIHYPSQAMTRTRN
jgi:hypothetical protein